MIQLSLLFDLSAVCVDDLAITPEGLSVSVHSETPDALCPVCEQVAHRVQSRYTRTLQDVTWGGKMLRLSVLVRRFFCDTPSCKRRIFAERLPTLAPAYARRTVRLTTALSELGFALGGKAGASLGKTLGLVSSRDTLLRILKRLPAPSPSSPKLLGVDDWAFRRGKTYGTLLVDLEQGTVVEVLPDRQAATLAAWLRQHPEIELLSRDRGGQYALGAALGAPQAIQVADRFHLLLNLSESGERALQAHRQEIKHIRLSSAAASAPLTGIRSLQPGRERAKEQARQRRLQRYEAVQQLYAQGITLRKIAQHLHLDRKTVALFAHAAVFPERSASPVRTRGVAAYAAYLQSRWKEGSHTSVGLYREIKEQGYKGSQNAVEGFLRELRNWEEQGIDTSSVVTTVEVTPRRAVGLMLRRDEDQTEEERIALTHLCELHPDIHRIQLLLRWFAQMLRQRRGEELDQWLDAALHSGIAELRSFARKLRQDQEAVQAGLILKWNNGPLEGHVNRLKLIKRSMYGRAHFDLLRLRVLHQRKCA
jgi:transposase